MLPISKTALINAMKDPDSHVREAAANALELSEREENLNGLFKHYENGDRQAKLWAIFALQQLGDLVGSQCRLDYQFFF